MSSAHALHPPWQPWNSSNCLDEIRNWTNYRQNVHFLFYGLKKIPISINLYNDVIRGLVWNKMLNYSQQTINCNRTDVSIACIDMLVIAFFSLIFNCTIRHPFRHYRINETPSQWNDFRKFLRSSVIKYCSKADRC